MSEHSLKCSRTALSFFVACSEYRVNKSYMFCQHQDRQIYKQCSTWTSRVLDLSFRYRANFVCWINNLKCWCLSWNKISILFLMIKRVALLSIQRKVDVTTVSAVHWQCSYFQIVVGGLLRFLFLLTTKWAVAQLNSQHTYVLMVAGSISPLLS